MTHLRGLSALAAGALLGACSDYATFVTATNIGISADTTTQELNIGYTRAELFTGPGYPAQGEAPRVFGYINSDLRVFEPHIQQLYATGDAASLISYPQKPPLPTTAEQAPPPYYGERRPMVFGTGSTVGLNLKFAGSSPAPSAIKFGYNREEVSIIPMQSQTPADQNHADRYAPVLASMDLNLGGTPAKGDTKPSSSGGADASSGAAAGTGTNPGATALAKTDLGITQFFATGTAARNLAAYDDKIRGYFQTQAKEAVKTAVLTGVVVDSDVQARKRQITDYIHNLFNTNKKTTLDAIAKILGVSDTNLQKERNNIVFAIDQRVVNNVTMDSLSALLKPITGTGF